MTSRSEGREEVILFVTKCDKRGEGGRQKCDVTLICRYVTAINEPNCPIIKLGDFWSSICPAVLSYGTQLR